MKQFVSFLLILSFFCFSSCEDILECIISVRPELHNNTLEHARLFKFYKETITADIKNEPFDDGYDYYF